MDDDTTLLLLVAVAAVLLLKPDLLSGLFGRSSSLTGTTAVPGTPGAPGSAAPVSCPQGSAWDGSRCIGLGFHPAGTDPNGPGIPVNLPPQGPGLSGPQVAGGAWGKALQLANDPGLRSIIGAPPLTEPPPKTGGAFGPAFDFAIKMATTPVQGNTGPEAPRSLPAPPAAVGEAKAAIRRGLLFTPRSTA